MARSLRWLTLFALLGSSMVLDAAVPPVKLPSRAIDLTKLPPGTIIVIGEEGKDALQYPGAVVVSPEKFKEMLAEIERLKRQASPEKPEAPSRLRLSGEVKDKVVQLKAQYEFETRKPRQLIALGGQKLSANTLPAWPTAVALDDGKLPLLPPAGEEGLVVQVETPGTHKLTLDLELLVAPRTQGTGYTFELGLPRAAITILDNLDLPVTVPEVTVNGRVLARGDLLSSNERRRPVPLGASDRLEVVWKGPAPQPGQPSLTATGDINVQIDEGHVLTTAVLKLQSRGGPTVQWQIQAPAQATLEVIDLPAGDPRAPATVTGPDGRGVWTIRLKESSDKDLKVRLRHRQLRPEKGKYKAAIGPFAVAQALDQNGTVLVSATPELRPRIAARPHLRQQDVPEELRPGAGTVSYYHYWLQRTDPSAPLMDIDVELVKGSVVTETVYKLRLGEDGWHVRAEVIVTPVRSGIESVEFDVPADGQFKVFSPDSLVAGDELELKEPVGGRRAGIVKLVGRQRQRFKIQLDGLARGESPLFVGLPRPAQTIDKGAELTVTVPEGQQLEAARDIGTETLPPGERRREWKLDKAPPRLELRWHLRPPEQPIDSVVDVTLKDQRAHVRQQLTFLVPQEPGKEVLLRGADFPAGQAPVVGRVPLVSRGAGLWPVPVKGNAVTLDYSVPLPEPDRNRVRSLAVPLFWVEGASRCLTRVRIWSDGAILPRWDGGSSSSWAGPLKAEIDPERDPPSSLVLQATAMKVPLVLPLVESAVSPLATLAVDRALIQADIVEGGRQTYRARFLLTRIGNRPISIELPGPLAGLQFEAFLNGRPVTGVEAVDEEDRKADTGRIARLPIESELYRKPTILEVRYQVPATRADGLWRLQTVLVPPRLRGNVLAGRVRWQVALPEDWLAVPAGGRATVEQRWGWRNGLPTLRPAATAGDLERWFAADTEPQEPAGPVGELICWQATLEPLPLIHVAQQTWLMACSLAFLALALTLYFVALPRVLFWSVVALLVLAMAWAAVGAPGVLPLAACGSIPGILVFLLVIGGQWLVQHRYRRQVAFMSGFSRLAPGSSIVRGSSSQRRLGDPSTVDVPPGALPS